MEGRANSQSYSPPDEMSYVRLDLKSTYPNQELPSNGETSTMLRRALPKGRKPRVCVVGAGMAGMRCAQVLGDKGIDVTILEARDRTGGRMYQTTLGGHLIDHGPNWFHGTDNNPILDLARELGATAMSVPEMTPSVYDRTGRLMGNQEGQQCTGMFWELIEQAFKYSNKSSASIPQDQSLLDFCKIKLKEMDLPETTEKQVLDLCYFWGDYIGGNIETQSLKYFFLEETIDEGNLFLASTYNTVLNQITKDTYAKANIQLSTKVVSVDSSASESNEDSDNGPSSVTVTTAQGTTSTYDEVVITVPLGYLKRNFSTFHPPLPLHLQSAINNISYGRLEKVYLTFPTAFWLPTQNQNGNQYGTEIANNESPFFSQWLAPSYTPDHWPVECLFLSSLPPPCAHPTLLFYMHGPLASHITDLAHSHSLTPADPSTTSDKLLAALTDFFRPYYSLLPNYHPDSQDCDPTHAFATDWTHDEFAGWGSYSNFQIPDPSTTIDPTTPATPTNHRTIQQTALDSSIRTLRHGAPERRVWFAGEATSPFVALGTVTGAWWSGEGVAGRITALYDGGEDEDANGLEEGEGVVDGGNEEEMGEGANGDGKTVGTKRGGTGLGA